MLLRFPLTRTSRASTGRARIIYICGYGRSGTSVLSRILGSHPLVFAAGSLGRISVVLRSNRGCSCGKSLQACPVWSQAPEVSAGAHMSPRMALEFLERTQNPTWIVDTSKTAYMGFWRPLRYKLLGYQVVIVHLVRNPKAVVESTLKGTNKRIEAGLPGKRHFERERTLLGWTFANMFAAAYRATFSKSVLIQFEDLVSNPQRELQKIESITSLDYAPVIALITAGLPLPGGHEISGNRALRAGEMVVRLSDRPVTTSSGLGWRCFDVVARAFGSRISNPDSRRAFRGGLECEQDCGRQGDYHMAGEMRPNTESGFSDKHIE